MVDLGGYIIILMNHNGKVKLYGSPADNADNLEVGDEILEVNGRTLENATHSEVIQHIHQCIKSRTICLRVRRRSGNKMEELDGPNAGRIRDAWVIAVERGARERLQRLTALRRIQPRDIQAILHQKDENASHINDGGASSSTITTRAEIASNQITVTVKDRDCPPSEFPVKLSNGTVPKVVNKVVSPSPATLGKLGKEKEDISVSRERKDTLEKQQSCPEESNNLLVQPALPQGAKPSERRASSPFQNGRTEVLIGDPEGAGPRSPRGSTSSAANDNNLLNPTNESDNPEPICRSRRRSNSGVAEIHLQQENNNGSREVKEGVGPVEGPDEMWAPATLGHHRELPVDVPDTLLQQAYPNATKVKVNTESPCARKIAHSRSASDLRDLQANSTDLGPFNDALTLDKHTICTTPNINNNTNNADKIEKSRSIAQLSAKEPDDIVNEILNDIVTDQTDGTPVSVSVSPLLGTANVDILSPDRQRESSVDAEEDYPFAKEDYPTMLKTCSDDSASPRSSSGRSDSTAPLDGSLEVNLDSSLVLGHRLQGEKDSTSIYDARRIDLGSPCRNIISEIKVAPIFNRGRVSTSFDNPAYGLVGLQDIQGLLIRSDEVSDLTRLIDDALLTGKCKEQATVNAAKLRRSAKNSIKSPNPVVENTNVESEALSRAASTDDLIEEKITANRNSRSKNRKKKQSSSGYSTLKSEASMDFDASSFVIENDSKIYREMAVDCPKDFVPMAKSHPVYPPPGKTSGTLKTAGNNFEGIRSCGKTQAKTSYVDSKPIDLNANPPVSEANNPLKSEINPDLKNIESINNNRSALLTADNVIVEIVDQKDSKVRSRVKKLFLDSFSLKHRKTRMHCNHFHLGTACNNPSSCFTPCSTDGFTLDSKAQKTTRPPSDTRETVNSFGNDTLLRGNRSFQSNFSSSDNLLDDSLLDPTEESTSFWYENPCLEVSNENLEPVTETEITPKVTFTTFRDDNFNSGKTFPSLDPYSDSEYSVQEKNQNSRNSFREMINRKGVPLIVYYSPKEENVRIGKSMCAENDNERKSCGFIENSRSSDDSPNTQNIKNARLSLEYKKNPKHLEVFSASPRSERLSVENLKINEFLSKSDLNLSSPLDSSISKVHSWLSDSNLTPSGPRDDQKPTTDSPRYSLSSLNYDRTKTEISPTASRNSVYESVHPYEDLDDLYSQAGLNGVKPAIPPRDQKRAPARPPKDNRLSQNNNVEQTEPTQQQLHSIRKYQEQLRKRKDEEEKQECLNRSLRGSRKLHALESHSTNLSGQENPAYAQDEFFNRSNSVASKPTNSATSQEIDEPERPLTYGEVVATLERLQLQLKNVAGALGVSSPGVEAKLEAVRTLLVQRRFATALATHHALRNCLRDSDKTLKPLHQTEDASSLARDCVEVLEQWQTSAKGGGNGGETIGSIVEELTSLLTSYEIEGLLLAHDSISSYVDGLQRRQSPSSSSPSGPPSPTSSTHGSRVADNIKIIRIEKTNEPLGATVRNEGDAVIIGRVVRGGAADKSGLLHEGDEVLEVNGVEMRGKSVNEVCDILAGMQGGLTFLVLPAPVDRRNNVNSNPREDNTLIQHVRAHFDYDPEEDPYIPCRELGVSFQKGDVLHVISQEDPSWWQAYREGEEDQTLAGLVPSKSFQHQRESMKQTIAGDKSAGRGSKKSSTLLCARKNPKKKKRSKSGSNFNDDGYPLYATTAIDDYDSEEVLTYEEVALYYPRANHKRPIVLIGPPNIGRHELRQRLMQDSERFAAAIPHTSRPRKDSEVDGQDYHFISRSQFESDILCRKFVEHGEYEKAYYGTSVEAIRSVVNSGKICVLNLHPQSLKILRSSDLKPYVVFVAPPSLEKLRQKRIKNNENFKEEELKDIIEKARDMEDKYGHLFDMIIINNDTDRAYNQLLTEINSLEREPQWVPASWLQ